MCEVHNKDLFFDLQQDAVFERERKETTHRVSPSVSPSGGGEGTLFPSIATASRIGNGNENGVEMAGGSF